MLLPTVIDDLSQNDPNRIIYKFPWSTNVVDGFQAISVSTYSNAINRASWPSNWWTFTRTYVPRQWQVRWTFAQFLIQLQHTHIARYFEVCSQLINYDLGFGWSIGDIDADILLRINDPEFLLFILISPDANLILQSCSRTQEYSHVPQCSIFPIPSQRVPCRSTTLSSSQAA